MSNLEHQPVRIVVLGAGYAGLTCFLELQENLPRGHDLVLVNADRYHWLTTELHTYVAGEERNAVRIPLSRVITRPGRLVIGRVERVDPQERSVQLDDGSTLPYDLLVFALGSDPEYYGLPGVPEHSLIVGNWQGATEVRERIGELLSDHPTGETVPHVVIAGGGLTGVEVVGELADRHPGQLRLTLVEAGPEIMAGFASQLVAMAHSVLTGKGIQIRTGNPIAQVEPHRITFQDGAQMEFDLLIWAGGVRGSSVLERSGLATNRRGRGVVDAYLRAEGHPDIYIIGDAAAALDPASGKEVPPSAQAAVQMGHGVGRNILHRLRHQPEQPVVVKQRGAFASLGLHTGVGQIGADQYSGLPALLIKQAIEAHHAWESGGGVLPLVQRLLRSPRWFLRGYPKAALRLSRRAAQPAPGATSPPSTL